jgi:hypothetical protein
VRRKFKNLRQKLEKIKDKEIKKMMEMICSSEIEKVEDKK